MCYHRNKIVEKYSTSTFNEERKKGGGGKRKQEEIEERVDACYNEREKERERARGKVLITSSHVEPMPRNAMVAIARAGRFL